MKASIFFIILKITFIFDSEIYINNYLIFILLSLIMNLLTIRDIAKIDHLYITKIYYFLEKNFLAGKISYTHL
jgi:hypothetical protein